MSDKIMHDVRRVEVVEVIHVVNCRGAGVPGDPIRLVHTWWTKDGDRLFERDPVNDEASIT